MNGICGVSLIHSKQTVYSPLNMEYMYDSLIYRLNLAIAYRVYHPSAGANMVNNNCISNIAFNINNRH
jgi:hypothetical protein